MSQWVCRWPLLLSEFEVLSWLMLLLIQNCNSASETITFPTSKLEHSVSEKTMFVLKMKNEVRNMERSHVAFSPCALSQPTSQSSFSPLTKLVVVLGWLVDRHWGIPGWHLPSTDSSGSSVKAYFSSFFEHPVVWMASLHTLTLTLQVADLLTMSGMFSHSDWLLNCTFFSTEGV